MRILVIEDNPDDLALLRHSLKKHAEFTYTITDACSLGEAKTMLAKEDFDIVLLDLSVTDMSGFSTLLALREEFPNVPVIIVSGLNKDLYRWTTELGAGQFVSKDDLQGPSLSLAIRSLYDAAHSRGTNG